ncbi:MAG: biotin/lipoyl-binding protein [Eubacterium sp.]|nr:biotin/lipoyl-binding protein [Eubacterium sp.]MBR2277739.1 biotin/lipoyl-binding protein [Eubacterium sp.]
MKNYKITVNGTPYNVTVEEANGAAPAPVAAPAPAAAPAEAPAPAPAEAPAPAPAAPQGAAGSVSVDAPMPGNIIDVKVATGTAVKSGDVLIILEAMKMENDIVAPQDGTIATINVAKGDTVDAGQTLITMN